jgi:galactosyltransferase
VKTLVLVLACRAEPYPAMIETIERTWAAAEIADVDVLFYYGGTEKRRQGRHLYLPVADDLLSTDWKTLAAFEHVRADDDFDVVFRTNCSSYVDLQNLRDYVEAHSRPEGYYAGYSGVHHETHFASGSGYFLSRDLVDLVLAHKDEWNHRPHDDVALGQLLHEHGIEHEPTPRVEYKSRHLVWRVDVSQFHFRCRTDTAERREDIRIMLRVHEAFVRARERPSRGRDVYETIVGVPVASAYRVGHAASRGVHAARGPVGRALRRLPGGDALVNRLRGGPPTYPYDSP